MAKKLIGIGDIVRVAVPHFFVKARYEKDFMYFYDKVILEQDDKVEKMLEIKCPDWQFNENIVAVHRLRDHIVRGIASYDLQRSKKTGNTRYLDVVPIVWYKGKQFVVYDVSHVATGTYQAAGGHNPWLDESWSEPPGLVKRKYHRILHISGFDDGVSEDDRFQIEAVNVEFVGRKTVDTLRPKFRQLPLPCVDIMSDKFREMFMQQPTPGTVYIPKPTQAELDEPWFGDKED